MRRRTWFTLLARWEANMVHLPVPGTRGEWRTSSPFASLLIHAGCLAREVKRLGPPPRRAVSRKPRRAVTRPLGAFKTTLRTVDKEGDRSLEAVRRGCCLAPGATRCQLGCAFPAIILRRSFRASRSAASRRRGAPASSCIAFSSCVRCGPSPHPRVRMMISAAVMFCAGCRRTAISLK